MRTAASSLVPHSLSLCSNAFGGDDHGDDGGYDYDAAAAVATGDGSFCLLLLTFHVYNQTIINSFSGVWGVGVAEDKNKRDLRADQKKGRLCYGGLTPCDDSVMGWRVGWGVGAQLSLEEGEA